MSYNVLIVDDSLPMRSVLTKTIRVSGFRVGEVFYAANGKEALDVLKSEWLDLVLTDYNMPDMDGLELVKEMKKDETLEGIPVVMVTTEGSEKRVREFIENGASDYIKKPFTPEEIRRKLNQLMGDEGIGGEEDDDFSDEGLDF